MNCEHLSRKAASPYFEEVKQDVYLKIVLFLLSPHTSYPAAA